MNGARHGAVRRLVAPLVLVAFAHGSAAARSYWYTGTLTSRVQVELRQEFDLSRGTGDFEMRLGKYVDFDGPVNQQRIESYRVDCDRPPDRTRTEKDPHGNEFPRLVWSKPPPRLTCTVSFVAKLTTNLEPLGKIEEKPLASLAARGKGRYFEETDLVTSDESEIRDLAKRIRDGSRGQIDAIIAVLNFVVDHIEYVAQPKSYSAIEALESGRGNCQNYAHLAAALLHDLGIEARIVNGLSLTQPWRLPLPSGSLTLDGAQQRHAWLEVNVPELGWLAFDPQATQFFISPHLVRQAAGFDSHELVERFSARGARPQLSEKIEAKFLEETNTLELHVEGPAPKNFVVGGLVPPALASGTRVVSDEPPRPRPLLVRDQSQDQKPTPAVPPTIESLGTPAPAKSKPSPAPPPVPLPSVPAVTPVPAPIPPSVGPSSTPIAANPPSPSPVVSVPAPATPSPAPPVPERPFAPPAPLPTPTPSAAPPVPAPPPPAPPVEPVYDELIELGLLDLSEDAYQYVTSKEVFAQRFETPGPIQLWDVSFALQKFGGEPTGELWVALLDDVDGMPREPARAESLHLKLGEIPQGVDFQWVSFSFRHLAGRGRLPKGRYWLALRYTPDAIVNWHARIGNPYLDPDDTRSRAAAGGPWNNILNLDFNFLVTGLAPSAAPARVSSGGTP